MPVNEGNFRVAKVDLFKTKNSLVGLAFYDQRGIMVESIGDTETSYEVTVRSEELGVGQKLIGVKGRLYSEKNPYIIEFQLMVSNDGSGN